MTAGAVVVTGMGAASALGTGVAAHRAALWAGRDGFRPVDRFDTQSLSTRLAATWPGWDGRIQPQPGRDCELFESAAPFPLHELALVAAREAWSNAGVTTDRSRAALVFGTCFGHGFREFNAVTERIAAGLELGGPRVTISTACSSSTNAIGLGRDMLLRGHADVVIAGGADALLREAFAGFSALGVLSPEPCAPFSDPLGTTLGEGAGFVVLERAEDAAKRNAPTWASICGYGLSADGFHETTPDPSGAGVARAIRGALEDADWRPGDIDFVSAHATGTANNDRIEWSVIERELVLGARAPGVSGSKGHIGHTQGAAGALELILALICHHEGCVPPTLHFRGPRSGCLADPIAATAPRPMPVARALKLSAAFGGANAVLSYGCGVVSPRADRTRAHVVVTGTGVVGSAAGPGEDVDLDSLGVDGRRLDRSARWLTAAAALALSKEAHTEGMDRIGLFVAATQMPPESAARCTESIRKRGVAGTSASAFARMSVNAPTGACTQALGLLGPTSTFSIGEGSGLLAVALAAEWLAWRDDATRILAGAVDEAAGAVCVALKRVAAADVGAVIVAGWGIAGPRRADEAIARAMLGRSPTDSVIIDGDNDLWSASEATQSCVMAAVGAKQLTEGRARSVLLVAARGASSVALVLERVCAP